jgi:hypothetical protein
MINDRCQYINLCNSSVFIILVGLMMSNATFNIISVIPWRSVLLAEETGEPGENHRPAASHWQTLSHNVVRYLSYCNRSLFLHHYSTTYDEN